jgi:hypothetical protein
MAMGIRRLGMAMAIPRAMGMAMAITPAMAMVITPVMAMATGMATGMAMATAMAMAMVMATAMAMATARSCSSISGSKPATPDDMSGATPLVCNAADQGMGSAIAYPFFDIEGGAQIENAVVLSPWLTAGGVTSGEYMALDLSDATMPVLRTGIACADNAQSCNVQWQVLAYASGQDNLPEVFENGFQMFDGGIEANLELDLSGASDTVDIVLVVTANNSISSADDLVFIHPRIVDAG